MKQHRTLVITSLISLLLLTVHLADDVVRGMFPAAGPGILYAALAAGVLVYGIVAYGDYRSGLLLMLLVSVFAIAMPVLHTQGLGVSTTAKSPGGFFFIWTLIALGMLGTFTLFLSLRALWGARQGGARE